MPTKASIPQSRVSFPGDASREKKRAPAWGRTYLQSNHFPREGCRWGLLQQLNLNLIFYLIFQKTWVKKHHQRAQGDYIFSCLRKGVRQGALAASAA